MIINAISAYKFTKYVHILYNHYKRSSNLKIIIFRLLDRYITDLLII